MLCQCMTLQLEKTKEQRGRFSLPSMRWNYGWLLPTTARCERGSQSCEVDTAFPATGHTRSPESRTDLVKMGVGEQHPMMPSWTWTQPWWRLSYYGSLYLLSGEFLQFNISMKWRGLLITECNQENDFGVVSTAAAGAGWCLLVLCIDGWDGRHLNQTHNFTVLQMYPLVWSCGCRKNKLDTQWCATIPSWPLFHIYWRLQKRTLLEILSLVSGEALLMARWWK